MKLHMERIAPGWNPSLEVAQNRTSEAVRGLSSSGVSVYSGHYARIGNLRRGSFPTEDVDDSPFITLDPNRGFSTSA
jgi:hypothetical protein